MSLKHSTPILLALVLAAGIAVAGPPDPMQSSAFSNQLTWGDTPRVSRAREFPPPISKCAARI